MAKQNVTFAERHLEKFIVGAAGLVLLGVTAYYGIMGPNKVAVQGQEVGPSGFYEALKAQASNAQRSIRSKPAPQLPPLPRVDPDGRDKTKLPVNQMAGFVPSPVIPTISGSDTQGDQVLVEVMAPKSVTARPGAAYVGMPKMEVTRLGSPPPSQGANPIAPIATDQSFVLVAAGLDRKGQADKNRAAKYDETRCQLIVAGVQAERRELGPDGKWSEPVPIVAGREAYAQRVLVGEPQIKPTKVDGQPVFADAERAYLDEYRRALYTPEMQRDILRPEFQSLMDAKWQLAWQPPKTLPGFEFKLAKFGVAYPAEGEKAKLGPVGPEPPRGGQRGPMGPGGPRVGPGGPIGPRGGGRGTGPQPQPGPQPGVPNLAAQREARKLLEEARQAAKKADWKKLEEVLQDVLANQETPEKERKAAQDMLEEYDGEIKKYHVDKEVEAGRLQALGIVELGEDQEPMWITDIKVEPGKTYQYRLRVIAFNEFAGTSKVLKDPADAERVLIDGQWSEWCEPVTVAPTVQMFFTETRDEAGVKKARVIVSARSRGEWKEAKSDVEIGAPVEGTSGRDKFVYDGIVTGLDNGREYRPRNARSGYEPPVKTDVLTLVSAAGQVEERLLEEDKAKLRAHRDAVKKEKDLLATPIEPGSGGIRGGGGYQPGMPGPGRGGPMGDPRMGGPMPRGRGGPYGPGGNDPRFGGRDPRFGGGPRP